MVSEGSEYPPGDRRTLPETITAGGVTRWLTRHLRDNPDPGVTADRIQHVLENWVARGICRDGRNNREAIVYWGFVPSRKDPLRIPVSLDDQEIITAHFDEPAAKRIEDESRPWFQRRCRDLEVCDGS